MSPELRPAAAPAPPPGKAIRVVTTPGGLVGIAVGDRAFLMLDGDAERLAGDLAWAVEHVRALRATAAAAVRGD